jgi:RHS repeat-associated protein
MLRNTRVLAIALAVVSVFALAANARAQSSGVDGSSDPKLDVDQGVDVQGPGRNGIPSKDDPPLRTDNDCETCATGARQGSLEVGEISDLATDNDTGDPVELHNGMVSVRRVDMFIPGRGINFELTRRYSSKQADTNGVLGYGWEHSYDLHLQTPLPTTFSTGTSVTLANGNNRLDRYTYTSSGTWKSPPGVYSQLRPILESGSVTQWEIRGRHGSKTRFDNGTGHVISMSDSSGNALIFTYTTGGLLDYVTDSLGRIISFSYTSGRLTQVSDFAGRTVTYQYTSSGELWKVTSPTESGTSGFTDFTSGRTEQYAYTIISTFAHLLEKVYKPQDVVTSSSPSTEFVYAVWASHSVWCKQQKLRSSATQVDSIYYFYSTNSLSGTTVVYTTVTDRNGNTTKYNFDSSGHATQIDEHVVSGSTTTNLTRTYSYDTFGDGEVLQVTQPEGNKEVRAYDSSPSSRFAAGNLLTRTWYDKSNTHSRTQTYQWEPVFQHLYKYTDERGNATTYISDYMEGSCSTGSNYNIPILADEVGLTSTAMAAALGCSGSSMMINADVNGDGQDPTNLHRIQGKIIKVIYPTVDPSGLNQTAITTRAYNDFGQKTSETDAEENVTSYLYHPASDPDGDGANITSGQSTTTGGYLKQVSQDTTSASGRESGQNPTPVSRVTSYLYDRVGRVTVATDPRGVATQYAYDAVGELWSTTLASDTSAVATRYGGYDPSTAESLSTFKYVEKRGYDYNGNVVKIYYVNADALAGSEEAETGAAKYWWERTFTYDQQDRMLSRTVELGTSHSPDSVSWAYTYDGNGNLASETDPDARITTYAYDSLDRIKTITRVAGSGSSDPSIAKSYSYNDAANENGTLHQVAVGSSTTTYGYDGWDRTATVTNAVGSETDYTYDDASNIVSTLFKGVVNGGSSTIYSLRQEDFTYDERNRLTRTDVSAPSGQPALNDGPLTSGDGKVSTRYTYDRLNRERTVTGDNNQSTELRYDGAGRVVATIDAGGNQVLGHYDDNDNLVKTEEVEAYPSGFSASTRTYETFVMFDALDRAISATDNLGQTYRYSYNSRGDVSTETDAQGSMSPTTYINGKTVNQPGNATRRWYDGLNRVVREERDVTSNTWNSDGKVKTLSAFTDSGELASKTDDNGNATTWTYNTVGLLKRETYADSTHRDFTYDGNGRLATTTDVRGNVLTRTYDNNDRLTEVAVTAGSGSSSNRYDGSLDTRLEYDGLDRITKATDSVDGTFGTSDDRIVARTYDALGRVLTESQGTASLSKTITYEYNWSSSLPHNKVSYPSSLDVYRDLDALNRVSKVSIGTTELALYTYAGPDRLLSRRLSFGSSKRLEERHHNGASTPDDTNYYDGDRRPTRMDTVNRSGGLQSGFGHEFDRADARTYERRLHTYPVVGDRYTHDQLSRLTNFERNVSDADLPTPGTGTTPVATGYGLDGVHNWRQTQLTLSGGSPTTTSNSLASGGLNEYSSFGGQSPTYDVDGNLGKPDSAGSVVLKYDAYNRLREIDGASGAYVVHDYDALGRRVKSTTSGVSGAPATTVFYYDGWEVIEERDGSDALAKRYVGGGRMDEPLRMENGSNAYFYHRSTLGNIVAITDINGSVVERYTYDAYGTPQFEDASGTVQSITASAYGNPYLFSARRYEPWIAPLYEFRNRFYLPQQGRFVQRDPIGIWGDSASSGCGYAFAGSRPQDDADPLGLHDVNLISHTGDGCPRDRFRSDYEVYKQQKDDQELSKRIDNYLVNQRMFHVAAHGNESGEVFDSEYSPIDPDKFARIIWASKDKNGHNRLNDNPSMVVMMSTCFGGYIPPYSPSNRGQAYAQRLADELGRDVIGATGRVFAREEIALPTDCFDSPDYWRLFHPTKNGRTPEVQRYDPKNDKWVPDPTAKQVNSAPRQKKTFK